MVSKTSQILRRERMLIALPTLIDLFAATKQIEGKRPKTISWYTSMLRRFSRFVGEEATIKDMTIHNARASVAPKCFLGARLYTMVLFLLDTGVRASELCSLTLDNVALNEGYMKVTGKGNKERIVLFGTITKKALLRYISTWRLEPESDSVDEVILAVTGTALTYAGLSKAIKRLGKRAGVPRFHAHPFRHTFAVRYLMNGGEVMTLRLILGHTTLDVTPTPHAWA